MYATKYAANYFYNLITTMKIKFCFNQLHTFSNATTAVISLHLVYLYALPLTHLLKLLSDSMADFQIL